MPPMQTELATLEGGVTDKLIDNYVKRAEALGLIIIEHSYITLGGQRHRKQLGIYDDKLIPGLSRLAKSFGPHNTRGIIQLNHAGAKATQETGIDLVAPSKTENARELSLAEIETLVYSFARAADRAVEAGFDGIEIHGAHGFLINQFFSPLTNHRVDDYGGSLENRMRFPLEVVKAIRERIGTRLLLYRLGSVDLKMMGTQIKDAQEFAKRLERAGVDIIDVSGGMCGGSPESLASKQGFFVPQATQIKQVVNVPVIGIGGIRTPEFADSVIREGKADFVAVGRALRDDSDWAIKAVKFLKSR